MKEINLSFKMSLFTFRSDFFACPKIFASPPKEGGLRIFIAI
jgi:hypothetical protein